MNVLIFGASGMVGQGVLRECLLDPDVRRVVSIVRNATGRNDPKLTEIVHRDFHDFSGVDLAGIDACFFCLGIASAGMTEADYRRITYDIAVAAAQALLAASPQAAFLFISGLGADSSERGPLMWARIKGATENALLAMPFRAVYVMRPGVIIPMHGIESRTRLYRLGYKILAPIAPLMPRMFPKYVLTTESLGKAMLAVARKGAPKRVLESADISAIYAPG